MKFTPKLLLGQHPTKTLKSIHPDERWSREEDSQSGHGGWITIRCFRFEYTDGTHSWADYLDDEQLAFYEAQPSP